MSTGVSLVYWSGGKLAQLTGGGNKAKRRKVVYTRRILDNNLQGGWQPLCQNASECAVAGSLEGMGRFQPMVGLEGPGSTALLRGGAIYLGPLRTSPGVTPKTS